jgi:SSS family solute:Na+ symporter
MSVAALSIIILCLLFSLLLGLVVSWNRQVVSEDYFLAGRSLPWYSVALGIAGASFGLEYILAMFGLAYTAGLVSAGFGWGHVLAYTLLVWVFLPYFYRKKLFSPGEFLERRYNRSTRAVFVVLVIAALVLGVLAPALYGAGWVLCQAGLGREVQGFGWGLAACIAAVGLVTAGYSVYGGLMASVWGSVFQVLVLVAGTAVFAMAALAGTDGMAFVVAGNRPPRLDLFLPLQNSVPPGSLLSWTGMVAFACTLAVWHSGLNPMTVQRCLGARSEWDAKMGIIVAGFLKLALAAMIVLPGLAVFAKLGTQNVSVNNAFFTVLQAVFSSDGWVGSLGRGLVAAGVLGALMSAASGVLHAVSAVWTIDVCQDLLQRSNSEAELVRRGRWSSLTTLAVGIVLAPLLSFWPRENLGILGYVLEVAALVGPPMAVVFVVSFFWARAHGRAATTTLVLGLAAGVLLWITAEFGLTVPEWLRPVLNRAGISGIFSLIVLVLATFIIPQNSYELEDPDTHWGLSSGRLPAHEQDLGSGPRNVCFWWLLLIAATAAVWVVCR